MLKIFQIDEIYKPTNSRSSMKPQHKRQETTTRYIRIKGLKPTDKGKCDKQPRGKMHVIYKGTK